MGIAESLSRIFKATGRDDPVFGSMLYIGGRAPYWEGKVKFPDTSADVEVFVEGLAEDDMEQQHAFFAGICKDWPSLREGIGKTLLKALYEWRPDITTNSVWRQFTLTAVSIPKTAFLEDGIRWDISFSTTSHDDHLFTVYMNGHEPQSVSIDG